MKLSISWVFDHIDADWKKTDITRLINHFNQAVAEIEGFEKVDVDMDLFTLAQVRSRRGRNIISHSSELKKNITLPWRDDAREGHLYMLKKVENGYEWAPIEDFCLLRQGLLPAISVPKTLQSGGWKKQYSATDYILDIDNKSINHRPDMWGHRGAAREISALLGFPFKPLSNFVVHKKIVEHKYKVEATQENKICIEVTSQGCNRFAGLYFDNITHTASPLWMALRLMRVGARPIDALVDITNYVMFDIGQPLHAFDANNIESQQIVVRNAKKKEKLLLLKDQEIEMTSDDIIVSDGKTPLALAGIRGGKNSGISASTTALFLEAAHFDASAIRKTSMRLKVRTEASARFEKSLDPNQNIDGILRFVKLLEDEHIPHSVSNEIVSIGPRMEPPTIKIAHQFIESKLGVELRPDFVIQTLKKIEFGVQDDNGHYIVTVPTFRATKDVTIKEDIVEEIGRFFGYGNMTYALPRKVMVPFDMAYVQRRRAIKHFLAFAAGMKEVSNYSFYDERFLRELKWQPENTITITNPQSENWRQLVTSLIPHLIKNVVDNKDYSDNLRFFEWGRTWNMNGKKPEEKQIITGMLFDRKKSIDFYDGKVLLCKLCSMLSIDFEYRKKIDQEKKESSFFDQYQKADLIHEGNIVGCIGKINTTLLHNVIEGDVFIFELDADYLVNVAVPRVKYQPVPKYPAVYRDISMMVPLSVTVQKIRETITSIDNRITAVKLIDHFEKDKWVNEKSLAFTLIITDDTKTLTGSEIEVIISKVTHTIEKLGATIR
ncbi:phenylalanine--tRNA ligase subunit beta [Candidatus Dependentiae bacterium]|nr:phenylalanine--tRNA ligase subunit beta [Candidatus Dependentiae bacterium]